MERLFKLSENGTTVRTEVIAGITTFLTMSYIIFVQPSILSIPMDAQYAGDSKPDYFSAVFMATCIASAIAIFIMAFLANYPIALAPGMGQNVYFAFIVCLGMGVSWQTALGAVFIAGTIFIILSFIRFREIVIDAIPKSLKLAISGGIGLLIAMVGLQYAGLIVNDENVLVTKGNLHAPWTVLSIIGVLIIGVLMAKKVRGAILIGMISTAIIGLFIPGSDSGGNLVQFHGFVSSPPSIEPTLFKLDIKSFFTPGDKLALLWEVVFIFLFLDLFDTIGTLIGVGHAAGFLTKEGKLPRAGAALTSDAIGTVVGASLGTSTVTSYIESSTGVAEGGRTGLANVVTGILFLLAIFFSPLVKMIGGGYQIAAEHGPAMMYPVIAGPLIIVGSLMMKGMRDIDWDDPSLAISSFIAVIIMPLTFSIATGIAFGFIAYVSIKLFSGKYREVHWLLYVLAVLFILRFAYIS